MRPKDNVDIELDYLLAILNSKLMESYHFANTKLKRDHYKEYVSTQLKKLPIKIEKDGSKCRKLVDNVKKLIKFKEKLQLINLQLEDYLGNYRPGKKLGDIYMPPQGVSHSSISKTSAEVNKLQIIATQVVEKKCRLILKIKVRYKSANESEGNNLDRWGYIETNFIPAMKFTDLSNLEKSLIKEFVPFAVRKAGGFANFRKKATKTISLIDRLENLTLPKLEDVKDGLQRFLKVKSKAEELDEKIEKTDELIDQIVYRLYGLTEEEIEIVEEAIEK